MISSAWVATLIRVQNLSQTSPTLGEMVHFSYYNPTEFFLSNVITFKETDKI
jgi:hypothetical protein